MKNILSRESVWTLYKICPDGTRENWGTVWMTDADLKRLYRWNSKTKRYEHREESDKYIKPFEV